MALMLMKELWPALVRQDCVLADQYLTLWMKFKAKPPILRFLLPSIVDLMAEFHSKFV